MSALCEAAPARRDRRGAAEVAAMTQSNVRRPRSKDCGCSRMLLFRSPQDVGRRIIGRCYYELRHWRFAQGLSITALSARIASAPPKKRRGLSATSCADEYDTTETFADARPGRPTRSPLPMGVSSGGRRSCASQVPSRIGALPLRVRLWVQGPTASWANAYGCIRRILTGTTVAPFRPRAIVMTGGFATRRRTPMGDKSPKSKQRNTEQKAASKKASVAKAKSKRDAQAHTPPVIKKK